jgi:hypothetical protein
MCVDALGCRVRDSSRKPVMGRPEGLYGLGAYGPARVQALALAGATPNLTFL